MTTLNRPAPIAVSILPPPVAPVLIRNTSNTKSRIGPLRAALIVGLLACWSATANAQWAGADQLYLGVGAGVRSDSDSDNLLSASRGASIRLGYEFNQLLGAELGYLDVADTHSDLDLDTEAWTASVVVSFPLTAFDLYGRLGAMHLDTDDGVVLGTSGIGAPGRGGSTQGFAALGAEIKVGIFNLYGEYTRFDTDYESDVEIISAGFKLRF